MKQDIEIQGLWHNQHRSEIDFSQSSNGQITGVFKTHTSDGHHEYPLTGYAHNDVIAFCVNFIEHGSVTAWVGQIFHEKGNPVFNTLWHMSVEMGKIEAKDDRSWKSILSGSDKFYRGPALLQNDENEGETETISEYPPYLHGARKFSIY
ncbi:MAG: avidin/streptavidin family protein [Candidatus Melainabacteria bacterium]|nr:avidin/streptavidin family protein [Candidatus Melainabacteria bacterium]